MSRFARKMRRANTRPSRAEREETLLALERHAPELLTPKAQARIEALKVQRQTR